MFENYGDPSAIHVFAGPGPVFPPATASNLSAQSHAHAVTTLLSGVGRRMRGFVGRAAMAVAVLAGIPALADPAAAQTPATVTIAAEREAYVLGLDDVAFVLTRSGTTDGELAVGVKLTQTQNFLDASSLMQTVTFAPDASTATLTITRHKFLSAVTQSGAFSAAVAQGDKQYETGMPSSATIRNNDGPEPPAIAAIAFASPAGTYAIGDEIRVSVAFDKPVTVTATPAARPSLELDIGGAARQAGYRSGSGSTTLVFAYAVAEGDEEADGIAIGAGRLTAPAGSLIGPGGMAASLTHPAVPADPDRKVDGVRPTALFATVDRGKVAVSWDEALTIEEGLGIPGGFVAIVGGTPRSLAAVGVSERRVTLALDRTVGNGEWVTVSYSPPDSRPVRDFAGNAAAGFSLTVTAGERGICARTPVVRDRIMVLRRGTPAGRISISALKARGAGAPAAAASPSTRSGSA